MKRNCVFSDCTSKRAKNSPYCSEYHESHDRNHIAAASQGLFLVEGIWGPPWPCQFSSLGRGTSDILISLENRPISPDFDTCFHDIEIDPPLQNHSREGRRHSEVQLIPALNAKPTLKLTQSCDQEPPVFSKSFAVVKNNVPSETPSRSRGLNGQLTLTVSKKNSKNKQKQLGIQESFLRIKSTSSGST
jgi:hypothetical protein